MKQYIYSPAEVGLRSWENATLRLEVDTTTNPAEADIFVCPGLLLLFPLASSLDRFPYMRGNEARHVFFDISENGTIYRKQCIFIRCNLKRSMLARDPNSISWSWPVEDYAECIGVPLGGFLYDVSFHGWLSCDLRSKASQSCLDHPGLKCDIARYVDFTGNIYSTEEGIRRRAEFRRSMRESRLALCPESIPGDFPYRFFEAMSAARVPVMVGSGYILPFDQEIPYSKFILEIDHADVRHTGRIIREFLDKHNDEELIHMGKLARHYWEKFLDRDKWPRTMAYAVTQKLNQLGLTKEEPVL